jgi:hypothetical protein
VFVQCGAFIGSRHAFRALMIRGDARSNQPKRRRQSVDDVDFDIGVAFY